MHAILESMEIKALKLCKPRLNGYHPKKAFLAPVEPALRPSLVYCSINASKSYQITPLQDLLPSSPTDEAEELFSRLRPLPHGPQHAACGGESACFLNPAHDHAEMAAFHNHCHTLRLKHFTECQRDLLRETFLNLESAAEHLGDACQL